MAQDNTPPFPRGKVLVVHLSGGPGDGEVIRSDDPRRPNEAFGAWVHSRGGVVGRGWKQGSPASLEQRMQHLVKHGVEGLKDDLPGMEMDHFYRCSRKEETDSIVELFFEHSRE